MGNMQTLKLSVLLSVLEEWMPLSWQESYDNCGLVLGDAQKEITKALICVDVTDEVLQEAIDENADLIISHHPPIFSSFKQLDFQTPLGKRIQKATKHDIAWYAMHTNLDNGFEGVNKYLADIFGLSDSRILRVSGHSGPRGAYIDKESSAQAFGAGFIGNLAKTLSERELLEMVKKIGGNGFIRHSGFADRKIKRIALCGGSGNFLIGDALHQEADVFITGELKYHDFVDADPRLWLIDFGHYESERHTKEIIYTYITKNFPTFAVKFSMKDKNSVSYL